MARLNRRVDGSGYYVTSIFTRHGITRKVTYQAEDQAVQLLADRSIRSGDEIPKELFFELLEEGLLYTGGGGAGEEVAGGTVHHRRHLPEELEDRRQIPTRITAELLNKDGAFISFGAFKVQYGGSHGYPDDILRPAYHELTKQYQSALGIQLETILSSHRPASIKRESDKVVIEFLPRSSG